SIDFFEGPVYSGARVVGLGGAYVAVAEDVDGDLHNPAAPAVRPFHSTDSFDYWLGFAVAFPADIENMDFFNSGSPTAVNGAQQDFVFATPALNLQWGTFGLGATLALQNYGIGDAPATADAPPATLRIAVETRHLQAANSFMDGQLILGAGLRVLTQVVEARTEDFSRRLFRTSGSGGEIGLLYRPNDQPLRFGFAFRSAIETQPEFSKDLLPDDNGDVTISRGDDVMYLPEQVSSPWDVNFGAAVQIGRNFNPVWRSSTDRAERAVLHYRTRELDREDERQRRLAAATTEGERSAIDDELDAAQQSDDELLERAVDNARLLTQVENAAMPPHYLLVSAALVISGPAEEAVGVDSFLSQVVNRSGREVVVSPRVGAESEVWPRLLKLRAGTYLEPTRFATSSPRWHATAGCDVRLIRWNLLGLWPDDYLWRVSASADVSERYFVWGLSIGGWYPRLAASPF
ncbi:MAG TPA: hypothetical protein VI197_35010, partial [Polyangiaceae bacterium]